MMFLTQKVVQLLVCPNTKCTFLFMIIFWFVLGIGPSSAEKKAPKSQGMTQVSADELGFQFCVQQ